VIQETFEEVLGRRGNGTINFLRHYVWKIAANRATDRLRQRSNRQRLEESRYSRRRIPARRSEPPLASRSSVCFNYPDLQVTVTDTDRILVRRRNTTP
jgi:DNA-directed RNA polymerase specialized sigma24 family protein